MKKAQVLKLEGQITKIKGAIHLIETTEGCFVWSSSGHGGNNSIAPYEGSYADLCEENKVEQGEDLGSHVIGEYCGWDVKIIGSHHH
jgi:hypothetical protein